MRPDDVHVPGGVTLGGAAAAGPAVIDVTEQTFERDVIERSRTVPVVLDFWASWCGPCRQLSPVLERLATEAGGRWVLAKVDCDANPRLAQAAAVQSIPAVKAVVDGNLVGEFTGALPEQQVRTWLARTLGLEDGPVADPGLEQAEAALARGDLDAAAEGYRAVLAADPANAAARAGLARAELLARTRSVDEAAVRAAADAAPDDPTAQGAVAELDLAAGRVQPALDRLLELVRRTTGEERDAARRQLVALFDSLPPDDPRLARARRDLASALF